MNRLLVTCLCAFISIGMQAQVNFENLTVDTTSKYWKGNLGIPGLNTFQSGPAQFINQNDTSSFGDYWSGWAYSSENDTTSLSYATNDCAAIAGKGHNNSEKYGVAYLSFTPELNSITFNVDVKVMQMYVTNTTIAYRAMENGNFPAKKFGGTTGNDPDFFRLDIRGWKNGLPSTSANDTVHVYLADFRDSNNANDYIVKDWKLVDLSILNVVDSLSYHLVGSDTGSFGLNTPAYFCVDDMQLMPEGTQDIRTSNQIKIYPNPSQAIFHCQNNLHEKTQLEIINLNGQIMYQSHVDANTSVEIDAHFWSAGMYILKVISGGEVYYEKITRK
ncbi:MAG: DUF4465 domain-containing protein [Bacteroidetes bacterium]|nr:DUF4465 domain-containing protein [Bacteroidota bacterium]